MQKRIAALLTALFLLAMTGPALAAEDAAGTLKVQLDDVENTDLSLAGAEIGVKADSGKETTAETTDGGQAVFEDLPAGRYTVRIITPPAGTVPAAHSSAVVSLQGGIKTQQLTVMPKPKQGSPQAWVDGAQKQVNGQPLVQAVPSKQLPALTAPALFKDAISLHDSGRDLMRAVMYCGYGGPGYEPQEGQDAEDAERAAVIARTYAYFDGSKEGENFRKSQDAAFWKQHVAPILETVVYEKGQDGKVLRDVPSDYSPMICNLSDKRTSPVVWLPPERGTVETVLTSANPDWTDGNEVYSLSGGVFAVVNEKDEQIEIAVSEGDKLLTKTSGRLAVLQAPPGYAPAEGGRTGETLTLTPVQAAITETPLFTLKGDHGEAIDQEGAKYLLAVYKGRIGSAEALSGHLPLMEWFVTPDAEGNITFGQENIRSGDPVRTEIPLGTLVLKSITEPQGCAKVQELRTVDGAGDLAVTRTVKVRPVTGGITLTLSADAEYLGAASLDDAVFELKNAGTETVYISETPVPPEGAAAQLVSAENGLITTSKSLLPAGTYELSMKKAPLGFEGKEFAPVTVRITESGMKNLGNLDGSLDFTLIRSDVALRKTDADGKPEADVLMQATSETTGKTWISMSDEDGRIVFNGLPYDTYTAEQLADENTGDAELASFRFTVSKSGSLDLGTLTSDVPDGLTEENLPDEAAPAKIPQWDGEPEGAQLLPSPSPEAEQLSLQTPAPTPVPTPTPSPAATPSPLGADGLPDKVPKTDDASSVWPGIWQMALSALAAAWIIRTYRQRGFVF